MSPGTPSLYFSGLSAPGRAPNKYSITISSRQPRSISTSRRSRRCASVTRKGRTNCAIMPFRALSGRPPYEHAV